MLSNMKNDFGEEMYHVLGCNWSDEKGGWNE